MRICVIKQRNSNEPKFHHAEILDGAGKSANESLTILTRITSFRRLAILGGGGGGLSAYSYGQGNS